MVQVGVKVGRGVVAWGCDFDHRVRGFVSRAGFVGDDMATDCSALMRKVVANGNHRVKFPLNETAPGKRKSQIEEYLDYFGSPGVQHVAMRTGDSLGAVASTHRRGRPFLPVPGSYTGDALRAPAARGGDPPRGRRGEAGARRGPKRTRCRAQAATARRWGQAPRRAATVRWCRRGRWEVRRAGVNNVLTWWAVPSGVIIALTPTVETCTIERPCSIARIRDMASCCTDSSVNPNVALLVWTSRTFAPWLTVSRMSPS